MKFSEPRNGSISAKQIFILIPLILRICWKLYMFGDKNLNDSLKLKHILQDFYMSADPEKVFNVPRILKEPLLTL